MNKSNKVYLLIIIILLVLLGIMTFLYINIKNTTQELNTTKEDNISIIKNITTHNLNVVVDENNILQNEILEERDYTIDFDKIKIEIDRDKITKESIYIIITNNNENEILYGESFKIQKNINGEWQDLEYLPNTAWNLLAYIMKGNKQTHTQLDIKKYYGELDKGNYRVVKEISNGNGKTTNIYSNEFKIND